MSEEKEQKERSRIRSRRSNRRVEVQRWWRKRRCTIWRTKRWQFWKTGGRLTTICATRARRGQEQQ